jgi:hypothetical protein
MGRRRRGWNTPRKWPGVCNLMMTRREAGDTYNGEVITLAAAPGNALQVHL